MKFIKMQMLELLMHQHICSTYTSTYICVCLYMCEWVYTFPLLLAHAMQHVIPYTYVHDIYVQRNIYLLEQLFMRAAFEFISHLCII